MSRWWVGVLLSVAACTPGDASIDGQDPFGQDPFGDDPSDEDGEDDTDPEPATDEASTDAEVSDDIEPPPAPVVSMIGAEGGVVSNGCVDVVIPAGALRRDTEVTISASEDAISGRYQADSDLWRIDVGDEPLSAPIEVSVCFDGDPVGAYLFAQSEAGTYAAVPGARRVGSMLQGDISVAGQVFVGRRSAVTDTLSMDGGGMLDLLLVVDNSASMSDKQDRLIASFPAMVQRLDDAALDWRIGVVTTDMEDPEQSGRLRESAGWKWVQPNQVNKLSIFNDLAEAGVDGSPYEMGRAAAYTALETLKATDNAGFVREAAYLAVVIISDENDYSEQNPVSKTEFIDWLDAYKGDPARTSFSAVVALSDAPSCRMDSGPADYLALVTATGGASQDVCVPGFEPVLDPVIAEVDGCLTLQEPLVEGPFGVEISVGGTTRALDPDEWDYDASGNCVNLADGLEEGTVFVEYRPAG